MERSIRRSQDGFRKFQAIPIFRRYRKVSSVVKIFLDILNALQLIDTVLTAFFEMGCSNCKVRLYSQHQFPLSDQPSVMMTFRTIAQDASLFFQSVHTSTRWIAFVTQGCAHSHHWFVVATRQALEVHLLYEEERSRVNRKRNIYFWFSFTA